MANMRTEDRTSGTVFILSLGLFALFWAALAGLKADPTVLPGPGDVA